MARPSLVVTDFAGTTLRDDGTVLSAYRRVLSARGIPFTEADLTARRGASKRAVFDDFAGRVASDPGARRELAAAALADFEAALRHEYERGDLHEIDGAEHAVRTLRDAGMRVALSSGFARRLVDVMLARLRWQTLFDTVVGADDVPVGRPAPFLIYRAMMDLGVLDVASVAVVGDTTLDLRSANNARAGWAIGVLSGAHDLPTLGAEAHTHLLPSVAGLPALFEVQV
ncbi:MAG: HAD hydrolase-like protein [Chloroflexota bacterium]|nr:HAD hydrolase-like protein [Chloroflexota bacterium]